MLEIEIKVMRLINDGKSHLEVSYILKINTNLIKMIHDNFRSK